MTTPMDELNMIKMVKTEGVRATDLQDNLQDNLHDNLVLEDLELLEVMAVPILVHLVQDRPLIDAYSGKYGVSLAEIDINREEESPQGLMYFFSDNLGGYTREGLERSLK